jgi:Ca2+/Na+ antiporter
MEKPVPEQQQLQPPEKRSLIAKIGFGLKAYLTDWRNLLAHGLLGVVLLVFAIWAPINPWIKLIIILCLICFNVFRMKRKSKKLVTSEENAKEETEQEH